MVSKGRIFPSVFSSVWGWGEKDKINPVWQPGDQGDRCQIFVCSDQSDLETIEVGGGVGVGGRGQLLIGQEGV